MGRTDPQTAASRATALLLAISLCATSASAESIKMKMLERFDSGVHGEERALGIGDYDPKTKRLFVPCADKTIWVIDITDPANAKVFKKADLGKFGLGATSVSVRNGIVAVSVLPDDKQDRGYAMFMNTKGTLIKVVQVGALPNRIRLTPDGKKAVVACEGEPSADYERDPLGTIHVIDLSDGLPKAKGVELDFSAFSSQKRNDVRVSGKGASLIRDLEPKSIAISPDGKTAWVSLQENNALAIVDLSVPAITRLVGLGYKDHSQDGNGLDASDQDGKINIHTWPLRGLFMPDAVEAYTASDGKTYIVTANEGESRRCGNHRNKPKWTDTTRVGDLKLDPKAFPNAEELQDQANLGRLNVLSTEGDTDKDGDYDELYVPGTRSFAIWTADGARVWDSGDQFARRTAKHAPKFFNTDAGKGAFDNRSDDRGCEPENVVVGECYVRQIAFISLECFGGVMAYDVTDPRQPAFRDFFINRNFKGNYKKGTALDVSLKGLIFIPSKDSPTKKPLLCVTHEMSGTIQFLNIEKQ